MEAPPAFSVIELPLQRVVEVGATLIVGAEITFTATVAVLVQPEAFAPITVYVCVAGGATLTLELLLPVDQV